MKLNLNSGNCVRYYAKNSECNICVDICPINIISINDNRVSFTPNNCIECAGCLSACPNEAFTLDSFSVVNSFFETLNGDKNILSCKKNLPCLIAYSSDYLISFGLNKEIVCDIGHCNDCEISKKLYPKILSNIDEANLVLDRLNGNKIATEDIKYESDIKNSEREGEINSIDESRRGLFKRFTLKGAIKSKAELDSDIEAFEELKYDIDYDMIDSIKDKKIPNRRKVLFSSTKNRDVVSSSIEYLSFISNKSIDSSCNNCSMCYRLCPTKALHSDYKSSKIYFSPILCINCSLCHDVCESDSIDRVEFNTLDLFQKRKIELISFNIRKCNECDTFFTSFDGERLCKRCKIEEEEAKSLWGY